MHFALPLLSNLNLDQRTLSDIALASLSILTQDVVASQHILLLNFSFLFIFDENIDMNFS